MHIEVESKRLKYTLDIEGKYSIVNGDSGRGKTTLCQLITDERAGDKSIKIKSEFPIIALGRQFIGNELTGLGNYIVIIDEDCPLLRDEEIPTILESSHNYFIIMSRDESILLDSADTVFCEMKTSGKEHWLEKVETSEVVSKMEVF